MFKVTVYSAMEESVLYRDESSCVILPSEEGEISVMDFHRPIVSTLNKGTIRIDRKKQFKIRGGIAAMNGAELKIIIEPL